MTRNIIPFEKAKRSVQEVVDRFYQDLDDIEEIVIIAKDKDGDLDDIEEIVIIAKDKDGEWIFANSELANELEWIGSLYKFIHQGIMAEEEY
jgi:hypothetical protein